MEITKEINRSLEFHKLKAFVDQNPEVTLAQARDLAKSFDAYHITTSGRKRPAPLYLYICTSQVMAFFW